MTPEPDAQDTYSRIYAVVGRIPHGRVTTYGQIARHLGMPRGARTVGWAMRRCPSGLPWHRVVNGRGQISERGAPSGKPLQQTLLEEEGIVFLNGRLDLKVYGWDGI
jgi:methylated-DNA-protein-cysteine methyltransferase-like protein